MRPVYATGKLFTSKEYPKMKVRLIQATTYPLQTIAFSYLECIEDRHLTSIDDISEKEAKKITDWVLKGGHTPSLEAIHLTFNIRGISRVLSHQLVRHRIGVSIDQRTQRANAEEYCGKFYHNNHFILPKSVKLFNVGNQVQCRDFETAMKIIEHLYNNMVNAGVPQDEARYILPQMCETSMNFKVIYKAFQHIASVRLCHLMQGEMVECVRLMYEALADWCPELAEYCKPTCCVTGICNRNENNPTVEFPLGVCEFTKSGQVRPRSADTTFNLTKYSKDNAGK